MENWRRGTSMEDGKEAGGEERVIKEKVRKEERRKKGKVSV